jgi:hypothetical protein
MSRIITSRRKVTSEKDRYGGYIFDNSSRSGYYTSSQEAGEIYNNLAIDSAPAPIYPPENEHRSYGVAPAGQDIVRYSALPEYTDEIGLKSATPKNTAARRRTQEEFMPRIEYAQKKAAAKKRGQEAAYDGETQTPVKTGRVSAPSKLMIFVYVACIAVIAAIVIGTGVAISKSSGRVSALERDRNAYLTAVAEQNNQLELYENDSFMTGEAIEQDMEKITGYTEIPQIEFGQPSEYAAPTNPFDRFADWIGGIFGG